MGENVARQNFYRESNSQALTESSYDVKRFDPSKLGFRSWCKNPEEEEEAEAVEMDQLRSVG